VDRDRGYGGFTVTVAPARQSKWDGVAAFCREQGIDAGAVLAIGDGPNDVELLDHAAVAVVPADAHVEARARADHVVGLAAEGGWAEILDILEIDGR
jgi:hydroxymethylpyrimidine pyrophosphatase-like HAD family hydrolase